MTDDFCFDCKYSNVVDGMQGCTWDSGLKARQVKCYHYKRSWQKTLLPYCSVLLLIVIVMRLAIAIIWGV